MKHVFTIFCVSLFFYPSHMHGMHPTSLDELRRTGKEEQQKTTSNHILNLIEFPNEVFPLIQPHLKDIIQFFLNVRATCKKFNELLTLEKIGQHCKTYSQNDKDQALVHALPHYNSKRLMLLTLICGGVTKKRRSLLEIAVIKNDVSFTEMILRYNDNFKAPIKILQNGPIASSNSFNVFCEIKKVYIPLLFAVKRLEIAKILIAHGANIHDTALYDNTNVLWYIMDNSYPSNLMEFYLDHQVDSRRLRFCHKESLLHRFAETPYSGNINNLDNFIQKAKLLLVAIPGHINTLNEYKQTPLDIVKKSLIVAKKCKKNAARLALKVLIELFQAHGGFTTEDLSRQMNFKWMS